MECEQVAAEVPAHLSIHKIEFSKVFIVFFVFFFFFFFFFFYSSSFTIPISPLRGFEMLSPVSLVECMRALRQTFWATFPEYTLMQTLPAGITHSSTCVTFNTGLPLVIRRRPKAEKNRIIQMTVLLNIWYNFIILCGSFFIHKQTFSESLVKMCCFS